MRRSWRTPASTANTVTTVGIVKILMAPRTGGTTPDSGSRRMVSPARIEPRESTTNAVVMGTFASEVLISPGARSIAASVTANCRTPYASH